MTDIYSSFLTNMRGPEGSEINERLERLQQLERLRKQREATIGESTLGSRRRNRLAGGGASVYLQNSSRRPRSEKGSTEDLSVTDYGGARPKMSSFSDNSSSLYSDTRSATLPHSRLGSTASEDSYMDTSSFISSFKRSYSKPETAGGENIFAGIADSILRDSRRKRYGLRDNGREDTGNNYGSRLGGYSGYTSISRYETDNDNINVQETDNDQNTYEVQYDQDSSNEQNQGDGETEFEHVEVYEVNDDHGEEPLDFIQRLKQGDQNGQIEVGSKRVAPSPYTVSLIPSVPPMKRAKNGDGEDEIIQEESESEEDIVALAKNIHATFGIKSPKSPKTPDSQTSDSMTKNFNFSEARGGHEQNGEVVFRANSKTSPSRRSPVKRRSLHKQKDRKSSTSNRNSQGFTVSGDQNEFEVHEIVDEPYQSEEDEDGEPLKVDPRSSFYQKTATDQLRFTQSPGRLDKMQKYFTGQDSKRDPEITRELDGSAVKAEMENTDTQNILANVKSAIDNLVDFSNETSGSEPSPASTKKKTNVVNKQVKKVKNGNKSSDSDNDSFQTASESESRSPRNQSPSQRKDKRKSSKGKPKSNSNSSADKRKSPLTIDDKLKKLEIMTQEKTRKQSIGENDEKKPLPSYMSPTSASQKKTTKSKDSPPTDLVKDVRELKKFVQDNVSEPNTPVKSGSPGKTSEKEKRVMNDMGTQTIELNYVSNENYVCKHCGKSSTDPVIDGVGNCENQNKNREQKVKDNESETLDSKTTNDIDIGSYIDQMDGKKGSKFSSNAKPANNKTKWESKSEKGFPLNTQLFEKRTTPELKRSTSKESINSTSDCSVFDDRKYTKSKTTSLSKSYMKGTTSSILKNTGGNSVDKNRKSSAPDIHKAKKDDQPKFSGKGLVAQRAKGFETFSRANSQKNKKDTSLQRGNSADRQKSSSEEPVSPRLAKSKSVDEVHLIKDKTFKAVESVDIDKEQGLSLDNDTFEKTDIAQNDKHDNEKDKISQITDIAQNDKHVNEKDKISQIESIQKETNKETFKKPVVPKKPVSKKTGNGNDIKKKTPPPISPKPTRKMVQAVNIGLSEQKTRNDSQNNEAPLSPNSNVQNDVEEIKAMSKNPKGFAKQSKSKEVNVKENSEEQVISDGQFLTLGENPFIKNDLRRRNSFKGKDDESVWEKESRSRDSSLKRSNSFEGEKPQKDSSLWRSNTSAGERTSLTQLSWSDSGSSGSLTSPFSNRSVSNSKKTGSQNSFHGSYTDINQDDISDTQKRRSGSVSSQTSQNSVLNLLNSPSSKRDVVTGAVETDVDAAYTEYVKNQGEPQREVHDEASVERSHLEFAKKACDLLEFEMKTRDSSSDSQGNDQMKGGNLKIVNGNQSTRKTLVKTEVNNNKNDVKIDDSIEKQGKKGKKSFLKGKLFKK